MKPLTRKHTFTAILVFAFVFGACSLTAGGAEPVPEASATRDEPVATPEDPEPLPTATVPPEPIGEVDPGVPGGPGGEEEPPAEPQPIGPDGQALDPCLFGTWTVQNESVGQYLSNALNQGGEVDFFSVPEITGVMQMAFDDQGQMRVSSQDYLISVLFAPSEILQVDMEMALEAGGTAAYQADGTHISNFNRDITVTGSPLDSVLQAIQDGETVMVMEVTPDWFLGEVSGEGGEPAQSTYTCSGDSLSITSNEYGPWTFVRE